MQNVMRRLVLSFVLLLGVSLSLVGFALHNFANLREANEWNVHTYRVLLVSSRINRALTDVDADVRNFLLTGKNSDLRAYAAHQQKFRDQWHAAYTLTADRRIQQQRLNKVRDHFVTWQKQLTQVITIRRATASTQRALILTIPLTLSRTRTLNTMRATLSQLQQTEEKLLNTRRADQQFLQQRTTQTLWIGALFSIILAGGLLALTASNTRRLHEANLDLESSNVALENARRTAEKAQIAAENARRETEKAHTAIERSNLELQRSNEELGHFAYVASHDLQEPLRAISGCVQLLQRRYEGQLDARADQFIGHAVDGAQRMQTLINDLLAYSRVGTRDKEFAPVEIETVIAQVKRSLSVVITESGAQITQDPMPTIIGDAQQLEQVWQNFVSNALKFRGEQAPEIHLGARHDEENKAWNFSVSDHGPGIEPQYFERIWVMFQRLHTRNEYPGTGIGLAICKKIVERHGGTVSVESTPGQGTTFHFSIPDKETSADALPEATEIAAETGEPA